MIKAYDNCGRLAVLNSDHNIKRVDGISPSFSNEKVWIGDPCYLFGGDAARDVNDAWGEVFCTDDLFFKDRTGVFSFGDFYVAFSDTAHGDGCYPVTRGFDRLGEFGVDAGMFCIVPWKLIEQYFPAWLESHYPGAGVVTTVTGCVIFDDDQVGDAVVGDVTICTTGEDDEEEDDDHLWCDGCGIREQDCAGPLAEDDYGMMYCPTCQMEQEDNEES